MTKIIILLIVIYVLNLVDYFQTIYAVQHFGTQVELNPIARFLFDHDGETVVKLIVFAILLVALGVIVKFEHKQIWVLYLLLVFYSILVAHNFAMLAKMGLLTQLEDSQMTTLSIVCAVIAGVSAIGCGALVAYYKHLKKNNNK